VFDYTLFVRMWKNSPCLRVRYSFVCGRITRVCVYAIRAYADEEPVFACTLFLRMRNNCLCLRARYSCIYGRITLVCVYAIRAYADE